MSPQMSTATCHCRSIESGGGITAIGSWNPDFTW
jgi:hypothetical protein